MGAKASVPSDPPVPRKDKIPYVLPPEDPDIFTILLVGMPGVGKSLLSNFFIDGENS
jgi:hypothetical protein